MHAIGPTNTSPTCVTIDEVYGEQPGPCDDTQSAKRSGSNETQSSLDYFEDVLIHIILTPT